MATHFHSHDNSTNIRYPDTVNVHEHKAPTDESIRLMEDAHDKAIKNIIAKVKVENNLVNGECYCVEQPWNINDIKLYFKFMINGQLFTLEKEISRNELWGNEKDINNISKIVEDKAKVVMLWYCLKMFSALMYEKITGKELPKEIYKRI
jgi:hypothetical protein